MAPAQNQAFVRSTTYIWLHIWSFRLTDVHVSGLQHLPLWPLIACLQCGLHKVPVGLLLTQANIQ